MESWAFTVRYVKKNTFSDVQLEEIYNDLFEFWERNGGVVSNKTPELGSGTKQLHFHGILEIKRGLYRKKLMKANFHIKLDAIYNRGGWLTYLAKERQREEDHIRSCFKLRPSMFKLYLVDEPSTEACDILKNDNDNLKSEDNNFEMDIEKFEIPKRSLFFEPHN